MAHKQLLLRSFAAMTFLVGGLMVPQSISATPQEHTAPAPMRLGLTGVSIVDRTQEVAYFSDFTFTEVRLSVTAGTSGSTLRSNVYRFSTKLVNYYRQPSSTTRAFLRRVAPSSLEDVIRSVRGCRTGYLCLQRISMYTNSQIAGSVTDVDAAAWNVRTGARVKLASFVSLGKLPEFTRRAKAAIRADPAHYEGLPVVLPARYSSFPKWTPVHGGIRLWFPEYQFGYRIISVTVRWP